MSLTERKSLMDGKKLEFSGKLKASWIFESFLDKFIIVGLGVLGLWKFFELIVGVFK